MYDLLVKPFEYGFMQRALVELILISLISGIIGTFLILKNLAFISEALSHAVFPGIIISYILKINLIIGALVAGIIAVLGINLTSRDKKISENTATGILFSSAFAFGVILVSSLKNYTTDLTSFLIGNILGVSTTDIIITLIFVVIILLVFTFLYKKFLISTFDRSFAQALGINVNTLDIIFNVLIAIVVVISIQAVGNVLVVALLIIPPAAGRLLSKNVSGIIYAATLITLFSSITGLYLSYYFNVAPGATIVLVSAVIFFGVYLVKKFR